MIVYAERRERVQLDLPRGLVDFIQWVFAKGGNRMFQVVDVMEWLGDDEEDWLNLLEGHEQLWLHSEDCKFPPDEPNKDWVVGGIRFKP